jgi:hypothetical protein
MRVEGLGDDLPQYDGVRLRDVLDNHRQGDQFLATFEDGTTLCVSSTGRHSAWQDDFLNLDPWTLASTVAYADLPAPIRAEILRRADELDALLRDAP